MFCVYIAGLIIIAACVNKYIFRAPSNRKHLRAVFLHPDLGIGGAERLIVDAAVGIQSRGCSVVLCTNFHDSKRCFSETADGTLVVRTYITWFPRHVRGKLHVLCATVRMILMALQLALSPFEPRADVYIIDQVSAPMVLLRMFTNCPIYFYCHFPDKLCDGTVCQPQRRSLWRRLYRFVFDSVEEFTMSAAHKIQCNSNFTRSVTLATFPSLQQGNALDSSTIDGVLYPPINLAALLQKPASADMGRLSDERCDPYKHTSIVSINRFEGKKNIALAVEAFALLYHGHYRQIPDLHLYLAGGFDTRLPDNVNTMTDLKRRVKDYKLEDHVTFLPSFSNEEKYHLLNGATAVMYTPMGEHFGIVPIEAMAFGKCVIACNDGGPKESIAVTGKYGFLCNNTSDSFSAALEQVVLDSHVRAVIGAAAKKRCESLFSLETFTDRLCSSLREMVEVKLGNKPKEAKKMQ